MVVLERKALAEPRGKDSSHGNSLESSKLGESHDVRNPYTVDHSEAGIPSAGFLGPGLRCLITAGGELPSAGSSSANRRCTLRYSLPDGARKREKIGDRGTETRRFRSVPRSFPGFLLGPGTILFVVLFAQAGAWPRLLFREP